MATDPQPDQQEQQILRKNRWISLLSTSNDDENEQIEGRSDEYYDQIRLDAIRTLKRFPPNYSEDVRHDLQDELIVLINKILVNNPDLHYYQGYHDICLTFLLVLGKDSSFPLLNSITKTHLKYFMEPTMAKTHEFLSYLMPLINCIDSECAEFIQLGDNGHVTFALPWFITWYSHVLDDLDIILRLYDLFLFSHYLTPIYLAAQIVEYRSDEILSLECDMATLHQYLSSLPSTFDENDWQILIDRTLYLFEKYPPETLDDLNFQWKTKCKFIENFPPNKCQKRRKTSQPVKNPTKLTSLTNMALLGLTITVGGLAVLLWNQNSTLNSSNLFPFGNL